MHYLYRITNKINTKVYIGQTVNPSRRWKDHQRASTYKNYPMLIARSMRKHGASNFTFEVIATCSNYTNANELEIELIKQYNSHKSQGNGYNGTTGGSNAPRTNSWHEVMKNFRHTEENKIKISKAKMGNKCGNKLSDEQVRSIRELSNKKLSNRKIAKIHKISHTTVGAILLNKRYTEVK